MSRVIDEFKRLYPAFTVNDINGACVIDEQEAEDAKHNFRELTINGVEGWQFCHNLPKNATATYHAAQRRADGTYPDEECHKVLRDDCDSIFCVEEDGRLMFYICELKSSYTRDQITHAKDQIVGSYLKLWGLLNMLQAVKGIEIEIRGLIVAYKPTPERLSGMKDISDKRNAFCLKLANDGIYNMPAMKCERYWYPLAFDQDIRLKYIEVPNNIKKHHLKYCDIR